MVPHFLTLEAAALGLLALFMSFTFSMALSRFDARQNLVIEETNSIGTAALRAGLLPESASAETRSLFHRYVEIRVALGREPPTPEALAAGFRESGELWNQLWQKAKAATAADPHSIPAGLLVQALTEMSDLQEKRLAASRNHVPFEAFLLLDAIAIVSLGLAGYVGGLTGGKGRIVVGMVSVLVASVIGVTGDLDRSRIGFIQVNEQPFYDLLQSMEP
ncbi:hypothetical protein [Hypericibacter sp.]|uniref:bestrophin-like domain n=1 Tax=Hypericibacter sp. TaxID=2705401 RepID=UPI003D6D4D51